jgi:hypothetical protein
VRSDYSSLMFISVSLDYILCLLGRRAPRVRFPKKVFITRQAFKNVTKSFFRNHKAENYHEIVSDLLTAYKPMGCNMSLKVHFLDSHLHFFPENLHQDISAGNQPQLLFR